MEISITARMIVEKFCLKNGILPKKYPAKLPSDTQRIPPKTL